MSRRPLLDDVRDPPDRSWDVVRSFDEFVRYIERNPSVPHVRRDFVSSRTSLLRATIGGPLVRPRARYPDEGRRVALSLTAAPPG